MNWERKKLGEVCEIYQPQTITGKEIFPEGRYKVFGANGFIGYYHRYNHEQSEVLVTCRGSTCGTVNMSEPKSWITGNAMVVHPNVKTLQKKFLFYALESADLSGVISGTGQPQITRCSLSPVEIPLPPLPVQQKIVEVLDTIQEAVELQQKIIEKTKELKKSLMNLLFHYGLAGLRVKELTGLQAAELTSSQIEKLGLKLKKTEIGEIPEHWEVVRVGEVCRLRKEQVIPNPNEKYIGLEHLDGGETRICRHGLGSEVRSLKNKFYREDILYGKLRPYLDKAGIAEFEGVCSTDLLVVAAEADKISPFYLAWLMHTPKFLSFARETMSGTNHPRTSWDSLKVFTLALPPLSEQKEIAEILQTIDQKMEIEKRKKELYQELFKTMLNKIMNQQIDVSLLDY